ncbi:MAG: NUDIX hydrolase [Clostridia bacterium]|nr:NUDIX hydrolase [Clostridia bacterium]
MSMDEIKISRREIHRGRILNLYEDTVRLSDGSTALREMIEHYGGSCVAALNEKGELLMVRQYRYGAGKELWELPAGKLEKGEDPVVCAARELAEETGYKATALHFLGCLHPVPAYCQEVIYMYYATELIPDRQHLDEGEFLEVATIPFEKAVQMVLNGEITDAKTVVAILKLKEIL